MTEKLPKYNNPPVVETVLGVEFNPLLQWQIPHFGLFWNRIRPNYQRCSVQPPLPEQHEKFGDERNTVTINITGQPESRCWFFDDKASWLLQIQKDRFLSNWKKTNSSYPNYKGFRERFEREWGRFNDFLESEKIEQPEVYQCEVTYINHIECDVDYNNLGDIFPVWANSKEKNFLPTPEGVAINSVYVIPENRGRLYIAMQPVVRHADIKTVIQLSVTARVKVASNTHYDLFASLRLGHDWVVNGFTDFTSDKIHKLWQRKQ